MDRKNVVQLVIGIEELRLILSELRTMIEVYDSLVFDKLTAQDMSVNGDLSSIVEVEEDTKLLMVKQITLMNLANNLQWIIDRHDGVVVGAGRESTEFPPQQKVSDDSGWTPMKVIVMVLAMCVILAIMFAVRGR